MTSKIIALLLLGSLLLLIGFRLQQDRKPTQYLKNCQKVQPGMTVAQAERIMGDLDGQGHQEATGILEYDAPLFARTGTVIYFDPQSKTVKEVICGDTKWSGFDGPTLNK